MRITDNPANDSKGLQAIYQWEASSWNDLLDYADTRTKRGRHEESRVAERTPPWFKTRDWPHALELARDGWPEGADKIKPLAESLSVGLARMVQRESWMFDVEGAQFDVAMMLNGEPEYWSHPEPSIYEETRKGSVVKILINGCVAGYTDPETITQFGIATGALIQTLTVAGIEADVTVSFCTGWGAMSRTTVPLKRAGEPLDIHRLAFAVAHPSMLRRVVFAVWESHPRFDDELGMGYGRVTEDPFADRFDLALEAGQYQGRTELDAQKWVIEHSKALGVTFTEEAQLELDRKAKEAQKGAQGSTMGSTMDPYRIFKRRKRYGRR